VVKTVFIRPKNVKIPNVVKYLSGGLSPRRWKIPAPNADIVQSRNPGRQDLPNGDRQISRFSLHDEINNSDSQNKPGHSNGWAFIIWPVPAINSTSGLTQ
jgi:hypothetical protein